jgi:hypothetical protein
MGDGECCAGTVCVHRHIYYPARYQHICRAHALGPRDVNLVHPYAAGCCAPVYSDRTWDYFGPRYDWCWVGRHG